LNGTGAPVAGDQQREQRQIEQQARQHGPRTAMA